MLREQMLEKIGSDRLSRGFENNLEKGWLACLAAFPDEVGKVGEGFERADEHKLHGLGHTPLK